MELHVCLKCIRHYRPGEVVCPVCGNVHGFEQTPSYALRPGTILRGTYLVGTVLGQGGFGITYVGLDLVRQIKVAVKEFYPMNAGVVNRDNVHGTSVSWTVSARGDDIRQRGTESFLKEARKLERLQDIPGVVGVRDQFRENGTAYIVMDFVEGETLKKRLSRTGSMTFDACMELLAPVMQALDRVHKQGIIHRDISPDNIMLRPDGSAWILDLGAAKDIDLREGQNWAAQSSQLIVKHGFSPAEQYMKNGAIGPWTDVYAMTAMVYYCTTSVLPPQATDRMFTDGLAILPPLTQAQFAVIQAGMALNPAERIPDMQELLRRLHSVTARARREQARMAVTPQPMPVSSYAQSQQSDAWSERILPEKPSEDAENRSGCLVIAILMIVVILLFGIGIAVSQSQRQQSPIGEEVNQSVYAEVFDAREDTYREALEEMEQGNFWTAAQLLEELGDYQDSAELACRCRLLLIGDASLGDYVQFGRYEQNANYEDGPEPVEWILLEKSNGYALLLSRCILDAGPYNAQQQEIIWEDSSLRAWLNGAFLSDAFSWAEQMAISESDVVNDSGMDYPGWYAGNDYYTMDRVFLLSYAEMVYYVELVGQWLLYAAPTPHAVQNGIDPSASTVAIDDAPTWWWWLRSPGHTGGYAANIYFNGDLNDFRVASADGGIRPVIFLCLDGQNP